MFIFYSGSIFANLVRVGPSTLKTYFQQNCVSKNFTKTASNTQGQRQVYGPRRFRSSGCWFTAATPNPSPLSIQKAWICRNLMGRPDGSWGSGPLDPPPANPPPCKHCWDNNDCSCQRLLSTSHSIINNNIIS